MEPELSMEVVTRLRVLATEVMVEWYRVMGVPGDVVVWWRVPALLGAVWSEN